MRKWTKPVPVDCDQFTMPANPRCPAWPVQLDACGCDPQDGYTCAQHRQSPSFEYHILSIDRSVSIRVGEYWVRYHTGRYETFALRELNQLFMDTRLEQNQ